MLRRALDKFARWALSKNAPGGYAGEGDDRWAYVIETDGSPYLTRVKFPRIPLLGIRPVLHHFHRPDLDQPLHNHPWAWALSLVLSGSYVEERLSEVVDKISLVDRRLIRFVNLITHRDYHRVDSLRGDVWTLFVTGPEVQDWGFMADGKHVPWLEFLHGIKKTGDTQ